MLRNVALSLVTLIGAGCLDLAKDPPAVDGDGSVLPPPGSDGGAGADAVPPGNPVSYDVHLRTEVGGQYLSAMNAGGAGLAATGASAREWELFHLVDENGGALESGDRVHLGAYDGMHFVHAAGGAIDVSA